MRRSFVFPLILLLIIFNAAFVFAQDEEIPPAEIVNDEGGVQVLVGDVEYTVGFLSDFGAGAVNVLLIDESATVDRNLDPDYSIPESSQILGRLTSDPLVSPFSYQLNLPISPVGEFRDVDNDEETDQGVIVMSVLVYVDMFGDTYWDDHREYSAGFNSLRNSTAFDLRYEAVGGKFVVWAPDDEQAFPSGFGEDDLVFTEDDPVVLLPAGYTVVDMDTDPFTFDRSATAQVDLIEAEQSLQPADYSDLSYTEAFDKLIDQMRGEYAFTEYKDIDWSALYAEFAPRFAEAEENNDPVAFQFAIQDFSWAIPDGHVGAGVWLTDDLFYEETEGSLGVAFRELDDGRVVVNYLVEDSPAAEAGFELGTEIIAFDGTPITEVLDSIVPWSAPFSTKHSERLQQLRYASRFGLGQEVEVTYKNPGDEEESTVALVTIDERESWTFSSYTNGQSPSSAPPIEFEVLENGYGYVRINTFSDDPMVMLRLWEWMIDTLNAEDVPGLIMDMRWNTGGYNIYNQMAANFFREEVAVGNSAEYYPDLGEHYIDPLMEESIEPAPDGRYYGGPIAVLVTPFCSSACEFFSYSMTLNDRAAVVGQYPTAGMGGGITPVFLPDGVQFQFTLSRAVDPEGEILFEGVGVEPTVQVPVTEETLFYDGDVILDYAVDYLDGMIQIDAVDNGEIALGETVTGEITEERQRHQYHISVPAGIDALDFIISESETEVTMRVYIEGDLENAVLPASNTDLLGISGASGLDLVVEIGGLDDAATGPFSLVVNEAGEMEAPADLEVIDAGPIAIGDAVTGTFEASQRFSYTLEVEADSTIDILLGDEAGALDTYLRVYVDSEDELAYENDDILPGTEVNSELRGVVVTAGQVVVIEAGTFGDTGSGDYQLTVQESEE